MVGPVVPPTDPRRNHHRDLRSDCVPATRPRLGSRPPDRQCRRDVSDVRDLPQDVLQVAQHGCKVRAGGVATEDEATTSDAERDTNPCARGAVDLGDHDTDTRVSSVRGPSRRPRLPDQQINRAEPARRSPPRPPPPASRPGCGDRGAHHGSGHRGCRRGRTVPGSATGPANPAPWWLWTRSTSGT